MIDAWEIMGRLATNSALVAAIQKLQTDGLLQAPYAMDGCGRVLIPIDATKPPSDYDRFRGALKTAGMLGPISLFAAGEFLVALRNPKYSPALNKLVSKVADRVTSLGISVTGRSVAFYATLGALLMDDQLRNGNSIFETFSHIPGAIASDTADAQQIAADAAVGSAADEGCRICWSPDCNLKIVEWTGHRHPMAQANVLSL